MPFTVSHVAFVLPLFRGKRFDPVALAIGSMAPDFGYFVGRFGLAAESHGLAGSVSVALPVAFGAWCFCRGFAPMLSDPLPGPFRTALLRVLRRPLGPADLILVPLSLLIGIWSHNSIDSFTHSTGWAARRIPGLMPPSPLPGVLQHAGSAVGLLVIATMLLRKGKETGEAPDFRRWASLCLLMALALALALAAVWLEHSGPPDGESLRPFVFTWVVRSVSFLVIGYLSVGAAAVWWKRRGIS